MLNENLPLSRSYREFLAVCTSEINKCKYCVEHHREALNKHFDGEIDKFKTVLRDLAKVLTQEPWKSHLMQKKILALGFSESQWQHAVMIVSYFNMANRCAYAMDLKLESDLSQICN